MKKMILFSIVAVVVVTFSSFAQDIGLRYQKPDCGGCGGGERVCCASTNLNHS
jgi:hypothetical protein